MIRSSAVLLVVIMGFFLIGASPAVAAGQDGKAPGLSKPYISKPYNWTGFYIGVNAGYGFGGNNAVNLAPGEPGFAQAFAAGDVPLPGNLNPSGFIGGGQAGYNYQFEKYWVAGLEANFQYADTPRQQHRDHLADAALRVGAGDNDLASERLVARHGPAENRASYHGPAPPLRHGRPRLCQC